MAKGIVINVGVNTKPEWGGFRAPIFYYLLIEYVSEIELAQNELTIFSPCEICVRSN